MLPTEEKNFAFEGTVNISEALGEVTQIYFSDPQGDEAPIIAKLPGIHRNVRGENIRMTAEPGKIHLFYNEKSLLYR